MARVLFVPLLFLLSGAAQSYEEDVHYGLTVWLADKAGFAPADAEMIGRSDWDLDRGAHSAVNVVRDRIIFGGDKASRIEASIQVRDDHFPGQTAVKPPLEPGKRQVHPGDKDAGSRLSKLAGYPGSADKDKWLLSIGEALHPFQDSWSHAGMPDIPVAPLWAVRSDYSWGHPDARGGWFRHRADLTCADRASGMAMASAAYQRLVALCKTQPGATCGKRDWAKEIEPRIREFLEKDTQDGKRKWFEDEIARGFKPGDTSLAFLRYTNLPKDNYAYLPKPICPEIGDTAVPKQSRWTEEIPPVRLALNDISASRTDANVAGPRDEDCADPALAGRWNDFLGWWLFQFPARPMRRMDDDAQALSEFFDRGRIARQIQAWSNAPEASITAADDWLKMFLRMWLVNDHGVIESFGHGHPSDPRHFALQDLFAGKVDFDRDRPGTTDSIAVRKLDLKSVLAFTGNEPVPLDREGEKACVRSVRFRGLPHDEIMFFAKRTDGAWKFVGVGWLAF